MKWTFNLEKAPWWGGIFERLVRSMKRCLKKTIGGARLTYEELLTVVVEVEMILNCRPLSYVSSEDPEEPITLSHLLCGGRLMSLPDGNTSDTPDYDTEMQPQDVDGRMRHLSNVINHFWKRWREEYLLELRNSHRYTTQNNTNKAVSTGDVVVVHDEDQPRGKWQIGGVEDLLVGPAVILEELLFESKVREENLRHSDVQCNAFIPWKSSARPLRQSSSNRDKISS